MVTKKSNRLREWCQNMTISKLNKTEIMLLSFVVLHDWTDPPTLSQEVFTQFKAPFMFSTKTPSEIYCFIWSTSPGERPYCEEEKRTLWNSIVNAGVATDEKRCIYETLHATCQQPAFIMTISRKAVPAGVMQRENHCSRSGLGGLQRCCI